MTLHSKLPLTSPLIKFLPELSTSSNEQDVSAAMTHFISEKKQLISSTITILASHVEILEFQKLRTHDIIAILEEAGGLTVRARNVIQASANGKTDLKSLNEFEEWFRIALKKLNQCSEESTINGVNLMLGNSLETVLDKKSNNKLITPGLLLTADELGIRQPDFSTEFSIQNSRIDIMNALDVVVSLRNTISSRLEELKTAHEFAIQTIQQFDLDSQRSAQLDVRAEAASLQELLAKGTNILDGETLAEPSQHQLLQYFTTSPNMEDI